MPLLGTAHTSMFSALSVVLAFNERDQLELVRAFSAGLQEL